MPRKTKAQEEAELVETLHEVATDTEPDHGMFRIRRKEGEPRLTLISVPRGDRYEHIPLDVDRETFALDAVAADVAVGKGGFELMPSTKARLKREMED